MLTNPDSCTHWHWEGGCVLCGGDTTTISVTSFLYICPRITGATTNGTNISTLQTHMSLVKSRSVKKSQCVRVFNPFIYLLLCVSSHSQCPFCVVSKRGFNLWCIISHIVVIRRHWWNEWRRHLLYKLSSDQLTTLYMCLIANLD